MLTPLLVIPLLGAIAILLYPKPKASRAIATVFSLLTFAWAIYLLGQFDLSIGGLQFSEFHRWIEPLGLNYSLGVDGLSLPLLALNALLTPIALYTGRGDE
ncbi:MAG: NAD(P)H-quinone oxidoreductase subunit D4, partial [Spirulina sp.]